MQTREDVMLKDGRQPGTRTSSWLRASVQSDGVKLAVAIAAMLIAFVEPDRLCSTASSAGSADCSASKG